MKAATSRGSIMVFPPGLYQLGPIAAVFVMLLVSPYPSDFGA
jgi:hypothetical protein